ncbi:MAG: hypothetical protein HDR88_09670 [Bacteroides sp.]|nr:hypothetical protein [Bacteroides sp.]MBD5357254.1 hypothetical protein [Bacteroides sp.]
MESVSTEIFKINRTSICRTMLMLYSKPWLAAIAVVLCPLIILGICIDLRWLIVALMVVFIIIPLILAFAFFYYGLNPVSVINSTYHSLEFETGQIAATLYNAPPPSGNKNKTGENDSKEKPDYEVRSQAKIDYSDVSDFVVGISDIILRTKFSGKGFLLIPLTAFRDKSHLITAIDAVRTGINQQQNPLKS